MPFHVSLGCMNRPWTDFPFERALQGIRTAGFSGAALLRHEGKHAFSVIIFLNAIRG